MLICSPLSQESQTYSEDSNPEITYNATFHYSACGWLGCANFSLVGGDQNIGRICCLLCIIKQRSESYCASTKTSNFIYFKYCTLRNHLFSPYSENFPPQNMHSADPCRRGVSLSGKAIFIPLLVGFVFLVVLLCPSFGSWPYIPREILHPLRSSGLYQSYECWVCTITQTLFLYPPVSFILFHISVIWRYRMETTDIIIQKLLKLKK
jgi:hypothetical protein